MTEAIVLLRSIDSSMKELLQIAKAKRTGGTSPSASIASDRDLDSQWGDPQVKFNPRDWNGEDCKGLKFSRCPPDFLDMLAETFDYFAGKAEAADEKTDKGKPVAPYKRADAARARGWAARIRAGKVAQTPNGATDGEWGREDDDFR